MTDQPNRSVRIEVTVSAHQPELLPGLDAWLQLGLISDIEVRRIARSQLTCPLPQPVVRSTPSSNTSDDFLPPTATPTPQDFLPPRPRPERERPATPKASTQLVPQLLSSLMAEISVIWLLFLGVFMVVVSSGVLAATQWQNFSAIGQYGILLVYTIIFWVASSWTGRQENLRVTSRMLQITTLLIIPVNFWMMDGFQLWQSPVGIVVAVVAGLMLSAIMFWLLRTSPRRNLLNYWGLNWLQWGWAIPGFPLIATYIGSIGTAAFLFHWQQSSDNESQERVDVGIVAIAFASLLLIGRAIFRAGVPVNQLGLALGISGWLLCWLSRQRPRFGWSQAGVGLLAIGWLVAIPANPPWQAIAVSGLGLWLLGDRIQRHWRIEDLIAFWLVGLQAFFLLWLLMPLPERLQVVAVTSQIARESLLPWQLIGLRLFPYVVVMVGSAFWLRRREHVMLADTTERLALLLGLTLAAVGILSPWVRSVYLVLSACTLTGVLLKRQPGDRALVYLTHITGVLTVLSWVDWVYPRLGSLYWALVLLAGVVLEWGLCVLARNSFWQQSSWYLGLGLAGISYPLFLNALNPIYDWSSNQVKPGMNAGWGLFWLLVPLLLTGLSRFPRFAQPRLASGLAVTAIFMAQFLTYAQIHPLLISLGAGTGLMVINAQRLRHWLVVVLTVGVGLAFASTIAWQYFRPTIDAATWLAIVLWSLWLLRFWAKRQQPELLQLYALAFDAWASVLTTVSLLILTFGTALTFVAWNLGFPNLLRSLTLTTSAILFRLWQRPTDFGFMGLAWGTELLVAGGIALTSRSWEHLAITNAALGLATQFAGDWYSVRVLTGESSEQRVTPYGSWHIIPIVYAGLTVVLIHQPFTATTGLYTLAAALTGIGIGRRQPSFKPLILLALAIFTTGAYELLIYQLMQATGGQAGDGLTLLAALAAAIAVVYQVCRRWLFPYLRLSDGEFSAIAELHWAGGSVLALSAPLALLSDNGIPVWTTVMVVLAIYALWQGRHHENWIYAGVLEIIWTISYLLNHSLSNQFLLLWGATISSGFSLLLYHLPWRSWGWSARPWQQSAILLPGAIICITSVGIGIPSLLITAGFYAWIAKSELQVRLSYLSVLLADWAFVRFFAERSLTDPLWYVTLLTGSLLYVAEVDPDLRSPSAKEQRHLLRCLATGMFCLTALYQSDFSLWQGFLTILLSIGLVMAGLVLRVRAFLYIGTLTFLFRVLRQLWLFINNYSLLLWALGIVLGLLLIWVAATFEARRSQAIALVQYWVNELEAWE
ncbi:hypothetical protein [Pantanalinema sp. GBBB05]|uniref:hypothetical protein n=1 Tax=Pantanalinema sp. GBBB05 TaxID=2604139 RepID=UPI001DD08902|nr:hypothetical protein [Pantanalinema sp. GBBB05]